ncbi:metallophosphoesterase [Legionella sp.]|uniref:metallophosphoesterase n=1 Tax=Legionella sp. TaxID=459 RepID=UPI003CA83E58
MKSFFQIILLVFIVVHQAYANLHFLTISDIHYDKKNTSSDGQDTGTEFLKISLNKMKQLSKNIEFIIFLGDIPSHALFNNNKEEDEKIIFHGLYQSNVKAKPLFYITGNNDSLQGDYQAFEFNGVSPLTYATDWEGACVHCKDLVIDSSHMYHDGYYSSYVMPHNREIILIALNANQWAKIPWLARIFFSKYSKQEENALAQFAWLEQQLKKHSAKQLLIAMHEPPGNSYLGEPIWYRHYTQQFIKILAKYTHQYGQITLLSAHTHMEEFRKIRLANGINIYSYSTPGISRIHHNYPGMKIFNLDNNLKIKDFITYYTSSLHQWNNQQYHALGTPEAIFADCQNKTLAQCMDELNVYQLCNHLDRGLFYGVKNPNVRDTSCKNTYLVN